jgi:hypothetical protein
MTIIIITISNRMDKGKKHSQRKRYNIMKGDNARKSYICI